MSKKDLITLERELEYIKEYIGLLENRFGKDLRFNFSIDQNDLKKQVIPLSLQLGIENAVKHNVVSKKSALNIEITSDNGFLMIKNNIQKFTDEKSDSGFGLKNMENRYELISGRKIVVENIENYFLLKIPLLEANATNHTMNQQ